MSSLSLHYKIDEQLYYIFIKLQIAALEQNAQAEPHPQQPCLLARPCHSERRAPKPLPQKRRRKDAAPVRLRGLEPAVQDGLLRHAGENRRHACALTTSTALRISSAEIKPSLCVAHRMPTIPIIVLLAIAKYSTIQNKQKVKHYVQ